MFDKMRRFKQQLTESDAEQILQRNTSGVLSVIDENGYPYAVPLSFVYCNEKIYFHSAKTGHKINAVKHCSKASFCIVDKDDVKPDKYTTYYRSVIAFGKATVVDDEEEKMFAIRQLGNKYYPCHDAELEHEIMRANDAFAIIKFEIEHITGKQARELQY